MTITMSRAMSRVTPATGEPLLEVEDLHTHFDTLTGPARSVNGVSYTVRAGQTLGVVGESGCGKSVTALSIMRLLPTPPARIRGACGCAARTCCSSANARCAASAATASR